VSPLAPGEVTVAVLGAGGTIAPAVIRDLATSDEVAALRLLDVDEERAAAAAREHGMGRAQARAADARNHLERHLEGCDVLINCAHYRVNMDAMRACLAAGCHYIDLGGLYRVTGEQLEHDEDFAAAGLLALLGMGSSPGKTNVMATAAVRRLPAPVERLDVMAAGRDLDPPSGQSFPYAVQTLVDEVTLAPVVLQDGAPVEIAPLSDGGVVDFGEPIGEADTIYTLHSEVLTFPESFGADEVAFALSLPPRVLEELRELVGASEERLAEVARSASPPSGQTVSVHLVEAAGDGTSVRARSVTPPVADWGLGGGIVSTASPAAAAVRLLARGRIEARGALPPERCIDPGEMFGELERRGVRFDLSVGAEGDNRPLTAAGVSR